MGDGCLIFPGPIFLFHRWWMVASFQAKPATLRPANLHLLYLADHFHLVELILIFLNLHLKPLFLEIREAFYKLHLQQLYLRIVLGFAAF